LELPGTLISLIKTGNAWSSGSGRKLSRGEKRDGSSNGAEGRGPSTTEELELALSRYALHLLDAPESLAKVQLASLMEAHGKQLRAALFVRY